MQRSFDFAPLREKEIQSAILDYLRLQGIFCWRNNSTGIWDKKKNCYRMQNSRHHLNGISDILGILPDGKFLAIEVKRPKNSKTSDHQKLFIDNINKRGGVAFVAKSLKDVSNKLSNYFKGDNHVLGT